MSGRSKATKAGLTGATGIVTVAPSLYSSSRTRLRHNHLLRQLLQHIRLVHPSGFPPFHSPESNDTSIGQSPGFVPVVFARRVLEGLRTERWREIRLISSPLRVAKRQLQKSRDQYNS